VHKTRWARLPFGVRMTIGGLALLLPCVGGVFGVGALMGDSGAATVDRYTSIVTSDSRTTSTPDGGTALAPTDGAGNGISVGLGGAPGAGGADAPVGGTGLVPGVPGVLPGATGPAAPVAGAPTFDAEMPMGGTPVDPTTDYEPVEVPPSPPPPIPDVETTTTTETEAVPFDTEYVRDPAMPRRTHEVRVQGEQGVKTLTYEVTTTDGQQTDKRLVSQEITRNPVTRVIAIGTGRRDCDNDNDGGDGDGDDGDGGKRRKGNEQASCDESPGS
jgi:hypothetical protein